MKRAIYLLLMAATITSCNNVNDVKISVENPCDYDRTDGIVEIPTNSFDSKITLGEGETYVVVNSKGDTLPSQLTYDGTLIFQSGLKANESTDFRITGGKATTFESKTYASFHPERKDDFNWENDRVGFRYYGAELKKHDGPSNGLDLWYKRTDKIVVDEWYRKAIAKIASFHVDHGEGCDPYAVGRTLGAGSIAPFVDGQLILNENFDKFEILENGPLRTSFKLIYPAMTVNGESITEEKVISLDAGAQVTKIQQYFGNKADMTVAAGIVKRDGKDAIHYEAGNDFFVYEEPELEGNGTIFLGIIIPQGIDTVFVNSYDYTNPINKKTFNLSNTLASTTAKPNEVLTYYTGFGWDKFGFANAKEFDQYVANYSQGLKKPFIIKHLK